MYVHQLAKQFNNQLERSSNKNNKNNVSSYHPMIIKENTSHVFSRVLRVYEMILWYYWYGIMVKY